MSARAAAVAFNLTFPEQEPLDRLHLIYDNKSAPTSHLVQLFLGRRGMTISPLCIVTYTQTDLPGLYS